MAKNKKQTSSPDKKTKKKESAWEFTRSMLFLIGLVVFIKFFICDIFFIPSGSMEQTLHGHPENGDRIFCTKINYLWRDPERWEVFVFKFPYQQTSEGASSPYKGEHFIKRCVGLPGESIALVGGDVFVIPPESRSKTAENAQRMVKSHDIQDTIWIPVYSEDFSYLSLEEFQYYWKLVNGAQSELTIKNNSLMTESDTTQVSLEFKPHTRFESLNGIPDRYVRRQVVEFACPVIGCNGRVRKTVNSPKMTARCPKCGEYLQESDVISYDYRTGYPSNYQSTFEKVSEVADPQYRSEWWHFVPDLSISTRIRLINENSVIRYNILSDKNQYSAIFHLNKVTVLKDNTVINEFPLSITPKSDTDIQFYHLDGQLRGYVNNREVFDLTVDSPTLTPDIKSPEMTNITLNLEGQIVISSIDVTRDIFYYYYRDNRSFFQLKDDGYMALGDNCPSSNDSRYWGAVPQDNLVGTAQFVWWPLHAIKKLH